MTQTALDALISTDAVVNAVTGTVDGVTGSALVTGAANYGEIEMAGVTYFGVDFGVEVNSG